MLSQVDPPKHQAGNRKLNSNVETKSKMCRFSLYELNLKEL